MKEIYEMHGRGHSARGITRDLGLARNTVLRYLNSPDAGRGASEVATVDDG